MKKKVESSFVPRLRFPEFTYPWEVKKLGGLGSFIGGGTPSTSVPDYWQGEIPWISSSDVDEDDIHTISITKFINERAIEESATKLVPKGSVLFVSRVGVGKLAINDRDVCTSQDFTSFLPNKVHNYFLGYFFIANKLALLSLSQGTSIKGFSKSDLEEFKVLCPNIVEQRKIANSLIFLDDLIATQKQKLEILTAHKKGLLQQLFPAEGAAVPNLRFPEFRGALGWEEKMFGEICKFIRGPFGGSLRKDIFTKDGYAVYEQSHAIYQSFDSFRYYISKEKFMELKRFSVQPDDIIMSCSGTMGKFAIIPKGAKRGVINQALLKLTAKKELDIIFIKATLELPSNQEKLLSQSAGGAIKNVVSVSEIKKISLYIPTLSEQQKIADCLSSLNNLIAAQSQKIDTLIEHKKGLMQQLFPSVEEI